MGRSFASHDCCRKRDLKCMEKLFKLNSRLNRVSIALRDRSVVELMPRLRPRLKTINGRRYSSIWFALKAIQNNKLLRNGLTHNYLLMNGLMDSAPEDGVQHMSINGSRDDNSSTDATNDKAVAKDSGFKVVEVNDKSALVLVSAEEFDYELSFGAIRCTLLSPDFDIHLNGFTLTTDESIDLTAVFGHKVLIKCQKNGKTEKKTIDGLRERLQTLGAKDLESVMNQLESNSCVILTEKLSSSLLLYLESVQNFKPLNVKSGSDWFEMRTVGTNGYESIKVWDKLSEELSFTANDVIIVTGGTNVGKTSLIRRLINRYLSAKTANGEQRECVFMDCDPGQSEFTTSAQLSLTHIQNPILSSTVLNVTKHKPLMACSVGSTTPSKVPKLYISSASHLVKYFRNNLQSKGPLFVNTMGWTRDLGLALLTDIIKISLPTHVLQMNSTADKSINFGFDLTPESVKRYNGYRYIGFDRNKSLRYKLSIIESSNRRSKTTQTIRDLQHLSYMSQMPDIAFKPFFAMTPYKLLWSKVYVNIVSDYRFQQQLSLDILNCCWVHLCRLDGQSPRYFMKNGLKIIDYIDGNQCLGSAIIRGIDFQKKCFYILSPESREVLDSVNCVVKPSGVQIPERLILEQLNHSSTSNLPYIYTKT